MRSQRVVYIGTNKYGSLKLLTTDLSLNIINKNVKSKIKEGIINQTG